MLSMCTTTKGIPAVFPSHERLPLTSFLQLTILPPSWQPWLAAQCIIYWNHTILFPFEDRCVKRISTYTDKEFSQHSKDIFCLVSFRGRDTKLLNRKYQNTLTHHHHHHHHHISFMELGHLLTRSGLTYPQVSSKVYHDSFCQLGE